MFGARRITRKMVSDWLRSHACNLVKQCFYPGLFFALLIFFLAYRLAHSEPSSFPHNFYRTQSTLQKSIHNDKHANIWGIPVRHPLPSDYQNEIITGSIQKSSGQDDSDQQLNTYIIQSAKKYLENTPEIDSKKEGYRGEQARVWEKQLQWLPSFNISGDIDSDKVNNIRLNARQKLWDWGATSANIQGQKFRVDVAINQYRIAQEQTLIEFVRNYILVEKLKAELQLVDDNLLSYQKFLDIFEQKRHAVSKNRIPLDIIRIKMNDNKIEKSELLAELKIVQNIFARKLGENIADKQPALPFINPPVAMHFNLDKLINQAPVIRLAETNYEFRQTVVNETRSDQFPEIFLEGYVQQGNDPDTALRLGLNTDFPKFGRGGYTIDYLESQRQQAYLQISKEKNILADAMKRYYIQFESLTSKIEILRQQQIVRKDLLENYIEEYKSDKQQLKDIIEIQDDYYKAQKKLLNLQYERGLSSYETLSRLGRLVPYFIKENKEGRIPQ